MNKRLWCVFTGLCGLLMLATCATPSGAQTTEVKEKPPMYSYVANWQIPRAHWAEMEAFNAAHQAIMDKALADGTLVGYGNDENRVHQPDTETHDTWWSSMSMAGLMKVLDQQMASGNAAPSVLDTATKHWDSIYLSRYYNWKSGAYKGGYVHVSVYKVKADAPDDAVATLSKNLIVPLMEKMLADGAIVEYEVDEQAIHTSAPGTFVLVYVTPTAEGLDKVSAGLMAAVKAQPLAGPAFGSMTDDSGHRDELEKGDGVFK
ncbi:MAG TPA: hypothetical protein VMW15_06830 [Terracidiphilus sp.]|nr:hypothetical protein [Terracidiphilus sp.]